MALGRRAVAALLAVGVVAAGLGVVALASGPLATFLDEPDRARAQEGDEGVRVVDIDTVFTDLSDVGGLAYFNYRYGRARAADPLDPAAGQFESSPARDETVPESCETRARAVEETKARPVLADFGVLDLPRPGSGQSIILGEAQVGGVYAGTLDQELQESPEFEAAWLDCVSRFREEGTQPVVMTVAGRTAIAFTALDTAPPGTPQVDAVGWLEPGLEVWVFGFRIVRGNAADRLQERSNPVEPAVEVAEAIMSRNYDETKVLLDDAFTEPPGVEYRPPEPGVEDRVRAAFRQALEQEALATVVQQMSDQAAAGIERQRLPEVLEERDPALLIRRAEERVVDAGTGTGSRVQVVVWDPAFLNTRAFRKAWRQGLQLSAESPGDVRFSERDEVREYAVTEGEGRTEVHWVSDCYTVKVASTDESDALALGDEIMSVQAEAAQETFGAAPSSDDSRRAERRRDRRNVARCSRPRLAELRSSVQTVSPDRVTQRKLEKARDAAIESHEDDGAFPADPDLLEVVEPAIDFRGGVAETTSEVDPVFVLAGGEGDTVCLSSRSPSDTLYMVKIRFTGEGEDPYDVTYADGPDLPAGCGPGGLRRAWTPLEDPEGP